ncbi:MAG: hypothetical protein HC872_06970 [Gammaproteobacteria bacterium]|nr:hypothetical protein [Gammaproteobacteria bacterium]
MSSREAARLLLRHADRAVVYRLAGVALMVVVTSVLAGLTPLIFKMIVDAAMPGGAAGVTARPAFDLLVLGAVYVGVHWSVRILVEVRALVHAAAHQRVQRSVSRGLFAHVLRLPLRFHLERSAGATGQTLANGLQGLQLIIEQLVFAVLPVAVELATVALVLIHLQQPGCSHSSASRCSPTLWFSGESSPVSVVRRGQSHRHTSRRMASSRTAC